MLAKIRTIKCVLQRARDKLGYDACGMESHLIKSSAPAAHYWSSSAISPAQSLTPSDKSGTKDSCKGIPLQGKASCRMDTRQEGNG